MQIKKALMNFDLILAFAALLVLLGTVLLQILLREVFLLPLMGAEEMTRYMVVWVIMTPLAFTERKNGHIIMEEIQALFPTILRKIIRFIIAVSTTAVYILIVFSVIHVFSNSANNVTATLKIPFWIFFLPNAIGFVGISMVRITSHICTIFKKELPWALL